MVQVKLARKKILKPKLSLHKPNPEIAFGPAKKEEIPRLLQLYSNAWANKKLMEKLNLSDFGKKIIESTLCLTREQLELQIENFPEGQIVGRINVDGNFLPVTMLNTISLQLYSLSDIHTNYSEVTANKTFQNSVPITSEYKSGHHKVILCVSIAVDPCYGDLGFGHLTILHGLELAKKSGAVALPFSAPRGFALYGKKYPGISIREYLLTTRPSRSTSANLFQSNMEKINSQMSTISPSYNYGPFPHLFEDEFSDFSSKPEGINAYFEFIKREGDWYSDLYGRIPTIVDFIRSTGREHIDPVLNFHIQNGADFIYNRDWKILGVLENSRPEDVFSSGYNILLNYGFTPLFFPNLENQFNSS